MRSVVSFNESWSFHEGFGQQFLDAFDGMTSVSLPHTAVELPFNYFDEKRYQRAFTYQKVLRWLPEFEGREVSIVFDGAMADSVVYLNGEEIIAHKDGYTPFEARLTGKLVKGDNLITVKVDGSENPAIPPFGGRIDYLTYAGIYRDVWLKVTDAVSIAQHQDRNRKCTLRRQIRSRPLRSRQPAKCRVSWHRCGFAEGHIRHRHRDRERRYDGRRRDAFLRRPYRHFALGPFQPRAL